MKKSNSLLGMLAMSAALSIMSKPDPNEFGKKRPSVSGQWVKSEMTPKQRKARAASKRARKARKANRNF